MQAIVQDHYGPVARDVLRLAERDRPAIGQREVLIKVRAASVGRGTWHLMAGEPLVMRPALGLRGPRQPVPGLDLAGVVEAVGAAVTDVKVGDEVFGQGKGAFAEWAIARADRVAPKPAKLSFEEAAAVPDSAITALQAVHYKANVKAGQHVMILGASGGVGSYAVQIAKSLDAKVTGVCSTAKVDFVRSLGADDVIDYTREAIGDRHPHYDAIIDIGGNRRVRELRRALAPKGTLVIVGGEHGGRFLGGIQRNLWVALWSPFVGQTMRAFVSIVNRERLAAVVSLIESGAVRPMIDRTYPLAEAAAAVDHMTEGRACGKVVITI